MSEFIDDHKRRAAEQFDNKIESLKQPRPGGDDLKHAEEILTAARQEVAYEEFLDKDTKVSSAEHLAKLDAPEHPYRKLMDATRSVEDRRYEEDRKKKTE